jgi:prophage antirepressor-like protein
MNNITSHLFKIETVRVFETVDGNILFAGVDIAKCLGYVNTKQAIIDNVSTKNIQTLGEFKGSLPETPTKLPSNQSNLRLINEFGLYELIFSSHKDEAKEFRNWVFEQVLPSIRKTGSYSMQQLSSVHSDAIELNSHRTCLTQMCENKSDLSSYITVGICIDELYPGEYRRGFKQRIGKIANIQLKSSIKVTVDTFQCGHIPLKITANAYPIEYKNLIFQIIRDELERKPDWLLPNLP